MGTSGLVGQFGTFAAMGDSTSTPILLGMIAAMHFILPALISFAVYKFMIIKKWISFDDFKLEV